MKLMKLVSCLLLACSLNAQKKTPPPVNPYAAVDKKALQIPDSFTTATGDIARYISSHFSSDANKTRAVFVWIANNLQYDVANMYAINFYETKDDKIAKALKTRKGICENYAALFTDICTKAGINSLVVEGYTKQSGFADYIPHAWCAALIDGTWMLFDPTWGSGFISNNTFVKKLNSAYYKAQPAAFIQSHMPFDYLWQFLEYPVTNQEFYEGKTRLNKSKPLFNFNDSIIAYQQLSHTGQLEASARRIEANGVKNALLFERLQHIKMELEQDRQNKAVEKQNTAVNAYNAAVADYNASLNAINEFITYRNNKFIPVKPDTEIQSMLDTVDLKVKEAQVHLDEVTEPDANMRTLMVQLNKGIADITHHLAEQRDWLKQYFSKGKAGRKSMFYKYTWFGIPLN